MATENSKDPYEVIINTMKREYPNGIPMSGGKVSEAFREFIHILFTPEEAEVAQYLGTKGKPANSIARKIGKTAQETKKILNDLTYKGLLHDIGGYSHFMAIAHLFNMGFKYKKTAERVGGIKAAELYQQFFIEDKFYHRYTSSDAGTSQVRVVPVNRAIDYESKVSNAEEIHGIIETCQLPIMATDCPCRKRTETLGIREDKCKHDFPIEETCFQVGLFGGYFKRRGEGRELTREEAHKKIDELAKRGLVFNVNNVINPMFHQVICSCCSCCCAVLRQVTRFEDKNDACISKANYVSIVNQELCKGCGLCAKRCPFSVIKIENEIATLDSQQCFGCGVCAVTCPNEAIKLHRFERSHIFNNSLELMNTIREENKDNPEYP
ncbi:MAG: 4Fe-4S binding protein [Candidatus Lokiarchaeota archaeon]|nr:4Fe-4S binding protein [Candidatus Lokiarchaeota archaeon]